MKQKFGSIRVVHDMRRPNKSHSINQGIDLFSSGGVLHA
jgi:hypothetical protein